MANKYQPLDARFWASVRKGRGCWEWTACKMTRGYGQISWNGKSIGAHIVSVLLSGRKIPKGYVAMHTCDNKGCVNPKHLVVVPHKINMDDAKKKGLFKKRRLALAISCTDTPKEEKYSVQYNYQAKLKRKANAKT